MKSHQFTWTTMISYSSMHPQYYLKWRNNSPVIQYSTQFHTHVWNTLKMRRYANPYLPALRVCLRIYLIDSPSAFCWPEPSYCRIDLDISIDWGYWSYRLAPLTRPHAWYPCAYHVQLSLDLWKKLNNVSHDSNHSHGFWWPFIRRYSRRKPQHSYAAVICRQVLSSV